MNMEEEMCNCTNCAVIEEELEQANARLFAYDKLFSGVLPGERGQIVALLAQFKADNAKLRKAVEAGKEFRTMFSECDSCSHDKYGVISEAKYKFDAAVKMLQTTKENRQ